MLKSLICSLVLAVASVASMAQGSVGSQEVSPGESRAVRAVVEAQLKALAANQPAQAFSYASPLLLWTRTKPSRLIVFSALITA